MYGLKPVPFTEVLVLGQILREEWAWDGRL
jgi:hypothetical protein